MVQTVKSIRIPPGQQKKFIEKPLVLRRVYIKVSALLPLTSGYLSKISLDDPKFINYYSLIGATTYFEAKGEGIFQGDIWICNMSSLNILYTATEILV